MKTKLIPLTQGFVALVDASDYGWLSEMRWYPMKKDTGDVYAFTHIQVDGKKTSAFMHRMILGAVAGQETDHRNGNGLDNRRENIRLCTHSQNMANRTRRWGVSRYLGVSLHKPTRKWIVHIQKNKKLQHVGLFACEIEAARAYDKKAHELHGEFARLNFGPPDAASQLKDFASVRKADQGGFDLTRSRGREQTASLADSVDPTTGRKTAKGEPPKSRDPRESLQSSASRATAPVKPLAGRGRS